MSDEKEEKKVDPNSNGYKFKKDGVYVYGRTQKHPKGRFLPYFTQADGKPITKDSTLKELKDTMNIFLYQLPDKQVQYYSFIDSNGKEYSDAALLKDVSIYDKKLCIYKVIAIKKYIDANIGGGNNKGACIDLITKMSNLNSVSMSGFNEIQDNHSGLKTVTHTLSTMFRDLNKDVERVNAFASIQILQEDDIKELLDTNKENIDKYWLNLNIDPTSIQKAQQVAGWINFGVAILSTIFMGAKLTGLAMEKWHNRGKNQVPADVLALAPGETDRIRGESDEGFVDESSRLLNDENIEMQDYGTFREDPEPVSNTEHWESFASSPKFKALGTAMDALNFAMGLAVIGITIAELVKGKKEEEEKWKAVSDSLVDEYKKRLDDAEIVFYSFNTVIDYVWDIRNLWYKYFEQQCKKVRTPNLYDSKFEKKPTAEEVIPDSKGNVNKILTDLLDAISLTTVDIASYLGEIAIKYSLTSQEAFGYLAEGDDKKEVESVKYYNKYMTKLTNIAKYKKQDPPNILEKREYEDMWISWILAQAFNNDTTISQIDKSDANLKTIVEQFPSTEGKFGAKQLTLIKYIQSLRVQYVPLAGKIKSEAGEKPPFTKEFMNELIEHYAKSDKGK
eukprot:2501_1